MEPTMWGPGLWHILFSITWNCRNPQELPDLLRVILFSVPTLLPCRLCQQHYVRNHSSLKRRYGEPSTAEEAFRWLYYLKDAVNKTLHTRSLPFEEFRTRYVTFGGNLDDVLVADTLLLIAIGNQDNADGDDDVFIEFCLILSRLLPLPNDSELLKCLSCACKPIVTHAYRACKRTRMEHGITFPTLSHVRKTLS